MVRLIAWVLLGLALLGHGGAVVLDDLAHDGEAVVVGTVVDADGVGGRGGTARRHTVAFTDPVTGRQREATSRRYSVPGPDVGDEASVVVGADGAARARVPRASVGGGLVALAGLATVVAAVRRRGVPSDPSDLAPSTVGDRTEAVVG